MAMPPNTERYLQERMNDAAVDLAFELEHFVGPLHPRDPMYWRRRVALTGDAMTTERGQSKFFVHCDDAPDFDLMGPPVFRTLFLGTGYYKYTYVTAKKSTA